MLSAQYTDHAVPAVMAPGQTIDIRVRALNSGDEAWGCDDSDPHRVYVTAWVDGVPAAAGFFARPSVHPGQSAVAQFRLAAPEGAGPFHLRIGLVKQNVAFFEDHGVDPLVFEPRVLGPRVRPSAPPPATAQATAVPRYRFELVQARRPERVAPGARFGLCLTLRNSGAMRWDSDAGRNRLVSARVMMDGIPAAGAVMPHPVPPGETVDLQIAVPAPTTAGRHEVAVGLVHEGVAFFEAEGGAMHRIPIEIRAEEPSETTRLYEIAHHRNSWFFQPSGGVAEGQDGTGYPLLLERSEGCHVWDTRGRRYIDYTMGWGCALLGHRYEPVQRAIRTALDLGATLPLPHRIEMEVTETLCDAIPCAEAVAFGKNGSDACSLAVRLARVATGRRTILVCGYHGWQDWYAEALGFAGTGVPERERPLVHRFPFNDPVAFDALLDAHRGDLAAVMLEPSGPAGERGMGPGDDAEAAFLQTIARKTRDTGAVLIFDEIITGFRYPRGGLQAATGVVPDLACFGKALANGMPLSAVVGRSALVREIRKAFYGPTYKGEILSLAAAGAALDAYRTHPVAEHVWRCGERLKAGLDALCRQFGLPARTVGPPFRFALLFDEPDRRHAAALLTLYTQELLRGGIIPYYGHMLPSYAHDDAVLARTLEIAGDALERVAKARQAGTLLRAIEIPLVEVRP